MWSEFSFEQKKWWWSQDRSQGKDRPLWERMREQRTRIRILYFRKSMLAHWPKYKMKKKDLDPLFNLITILFSSIFYYINLYFYFNPACIIHHEAYFEHQRIIQSYYLDFNKNSPITISWCENHSIPSQITNSLIHWSSLMSG